MDSSIIVRYKRLPRKPRKAEVRTWAILNGVGVIVAVDTWELPVNIATISRIIESELNYSGITKGASQYENGA